MLGECFSVFSKCRFAEALSLFDEVHSIFEDQGILELQAYTLYSKGFTKMCLGEYRQVEELFQEDLALACRIGTQDLMGRGIYELGFFALAVGAYEEVQNNFKHLFQTTRIN